MSQNAVKCVNCKSSILEKYCSHCGQPNHIIKISFKVLIQDFNDKFFGLDTKFGRTIKKLFSDPALVAHGFIDGNRVAFMGPVAFSFLMLTIYVLLSSFLGVNLEDVTRGTSELFNNVAKTTNEQDAVRSQIKEFMFHNFRFISILLIPFFAFCQNVLYTRVKRNFLEHVSISLYVQGQAHIFSIITLFIFFATGVSLQIYSALIGLIYISYAFARIYEGKFIINFIKGIIAFVLSIALYIFTATAFIFLFKNLLFGID